MKKQTCTAYGGAYMRAYMYVSLYSRLWKATPQFWQLLLFPFVSDSLDWLILHYSPRLKLFERRVGYNSTDRGFDDVILVRMACFVLVPRWIAYCTRTRGETEQNCIFWKEKQEKGLHDEDICDTQRSALERRYFHFAKILLLFTNSLYTIHLPK